MTKSTWKHHTVDIAWPTIGLFALVVGGHATIWVAALTTGMPLWAGAIGQTILAYLAFTVAHEAAHGNIHGRRRRPIASSSAATMNDDDRLTVRSVLMMRSLSSARK